MNRFYKYLLLVFLLFAASMRAQSISGVINHYEVVTQVTGNTIDLVSSTGFSLGDNVLLIQMTGITGAGTAGGIDNGAGNFVYTSITNILSATSVEVATTGGKIFSPTTERVQLVRVPVYSLDVTVVGTLTANDWNGATGGVIALDLCSNDLYLNAPIDANGKGFQGQGTLSRSSASFCGESQLGLPASRNFHTDDLYAGGDNNIATTGKSGAPGRGGHGGCIGAIGTPSGGGGTGGVGAISTTGTLSGGAGGGGYGGGGSGGATQNAVISGTVASAITPVFNTPSTLRLFMGAAGGSELEWGPPSGAGGGIVFIICKNIIASTPFSISANGDSTAIYDVIWAGITPNYVVAGGAGGGGSLLINATNIDASVSLSARGGPSNTKTTSLSQEYGGPGGGGFIITSALGVPSSVSAGQDLGTNSPLLGSSGLSTEDCTLNFYVGACASNPPPSPCIILNTNIYNLEIQTKHTCSPKLVWSSTNPSLSNQYYLEFSETGTSKVFLGPVTPKDISSEYSILLPNKVGNYRLLIKDENGTETYSKWINLSSELSCGFSLNPNPAETYIRVASTSTEEMLSFSIYSALGELILEKKGEEVLNEIDIRDWTSGLYFYKLNTSSENYSGVFVKK